MPSKKRKPKPIIYEPQQQKEQSQQVQDSLEEPNPELKQVKTFGCSCGKKYKSWPAVYRHIDEKHPNQKQEYKSQIIKPKKEEQTGQLSIRLEQIVHDKFELQLSNLKDLTLKRMVQLTKGKFKEFLIDTDKVPDDDESNIQLLGDNGLTEFDELNTNRTSVIEGTRQLAEAQGVRDVVEAAAKDRQLKLFKMFRFKLSLLKELSGFFVVQTAAKIQFSLHLIHACVKKVERGKEIHRILDRIWVDCPQILAELFQYYTEWNKIRMEFDQNKRERMVQEFKSD